MNALGAYLITRNKQAGQSLETGYPANDPLDGAPEPSLGLRARVRRLFPRRRVTSEPGFAATHSMVSEFVPPLRAYPYPPTYR